MGAGRDSLPFLCPRKNALHAYRGTEQVCALPAEAFHTMSLPPRPPPYTPRPVYKLPLDAFTAVHQHPDSTFLLYAESFFPVSLTLAIDIKKTS